MTVDPAGRRAGPGLVLGFVGAVALAALGLIGSRPDIVAMGLPLAILTAATMFRRPNDDAVAIELTPVPAAEEGTVHTTVAVTGDAEAAELVIVQSGRRTRRLLVPVNGAEIVSISRTLHSGPVTAVKASARGVSADATLLGRAAPPVQVVRNIAAIGQPLPQLPLSPRLAGLHGNHEGRRQGQGGDFRDIHQFVPGDELRRVDWRATARMARRPGDLLVRRTNTLSDASVVVAMDTADELGAVVATWGSGDLERSGVTSLDLARQAARSIAAAAVDAGDRIALHVLVHGGRSIRSGAGARHLARIDAAIAATGQAGEDVRFRRTPPVPHGSVIFVLSTFFDGAASDIALTWRASGHRVIAVDILPELDRTRLSTEQQVALRTVLAEREDVLHDLRGAGVDTVAWRDDAAAVMRETARSRR
ncbi:DUF58 domain-containing protein [Microbacterium murale]|uniref:DUF58 domain-containing protein n=1 Tax=Microbacterium murale TaxID=1081040 RepID=A0ABQ1RZ61_9MICO|nr:DUF58 domain-containing protein [Microbacterium murale]GGD85183.1 hypothetical protein GCM10007269_30120 [Microbacterium murale]